jgi:hypothetical protein
MTGAIQEALNGKPVDWMEKSVTNNTKGVEMLIRLVSRQLPLRSTATSRRCRPCRSSQLLHSREATARQGCLEVEGN